jgi:hypothetical protein
VREDTRQRATEFVKELYAAGAIDADRLDTSVDEVLAARSELELAGVIRSLPAPVTLTSQERQLARPLEIHSGIGRLRLTGKWQLARETHISADLGSISLDLTQTEFDDHVIDLHVYTGWGSRITPERRLRRSFRLLRLLRSAGSAGAAQRRAGVAECPGARQHGPVLPRMVPSKPEGGRSHVPRTDE